MTNSEVSLHAARMFDLANMDERSRYLQDLIGAPTSDKHLLHQRALLVSKLSEEGVWPSSRRKDSS